MVTGYFMDTGYIYYNVLKFLIFHGPVFHSIVDTGL